MFNLISAFSFSDFWVKAWDALTSKTALIVYAAIILVLILALVVRVALNEQKRVAEIKANDERRQEFTKTNSSKPSNRNSTKNEQNQLGRRRG